MSISKPTLSFSWREIFYPTYEERLICVKKATPEDQLDVYMILEQAWVDEEGNIEWRPIQLK